jgi:hypothetical protein
MGDSLISQTADAEPTHAGTVPGLGGRIHRSFRTDNGRTDLHAVLSVILALGLLEHEWVVEKVVLDVKAIF